MLLIPEINYIFLQQLPILFLWSKIISKRNDLIWLPSNNSVAKYKNKIPQKKKYKQIEGYFYCFVLDFFCFWDKCISLFLKQ